MAETVERLAVLIEANTKSYENAMKRLEDRTRKALGEVTNPANTNKAGATFRQMTVAADQSASAVQLSAMQTQNLTYQINDLAQVLATGQSPFRAIVQQGSQIVQLFGPGAGVSGAMKSVGRSILSFVTNPLNIAVVGFAVAAEAAGRFFDVVVGSGNSAEKTLDLQKQLIEDIRDLFGEAGAAATDFAARLPNTIEFRTRQQIEALTEKLQSELVKVTGALDLFGRGGDGLADRVGPLGKLIDEFVASVADGKGDIVAFREAVASLAKLDPTNAELQRLVAYLEEVSKGALDATEKLKNLRGGLNLFGRHDPFGLKVGKEQRGQDAAEATFFPTTGGGAKRPSLIDEIGDMTSGEGGLTGQLREVEATFANLTSQMDEFRDSVKSTFADIAQGLLKGQSLAEVFGNALKKVANAFLNSGIDRLVSSLLGAPGTTAGGLFGSLFGGFRAGGGPVMAGKAYVVGERGPELMVSPSAGRIIPANQNGGGGGMATVRIVASKEFEAHIEEVSGRVSVQTTGAGLASYDQQSRRKQKLAG